MRNNVNKLLVVLIAICLVLSTRPLSYAQAAVSVTNQNCSAYSNWGTTASGKYTEIGFVAVHYNITKNNPVIPFGTWIYVQRVTSGQGTNMSYVNTSQGPLTMWRVQDTGTGLSSAFWVDFFLGDYTAAMQFGNQGNIDFSIYFE